MSRLPLAMPSYRVIPVASVLPGRVGARPMVTSSCGRCNDTYRVGVAVQESDEAKAQTEWEHAKKREMDERRKEALKSADGDDDGVDATGGKNQFNYSERAAQTYNSVMKVCLGYGLPAQ